MFDPVQFIPGPEQLAAVVPCPSAYQLAYELAWQESHSGKTLSEAIESVRSRLGLSYDLASSLVWAEMTAGEPRLPG